jgi:peptidyl-prolyl cis-trans isomerase B (cyclophilin B)
MTRRPLILLVLALVLALAACGGSDDEGSSAETATGATEGCDAVDPAEPKDDGGRTVPTEQLEEGTTYRLQVVTNCGPFTITLDSASAPKTAASLVALARDGFFDGVAFHRVVPGFVIQGGDPTGSGAGGPGYSTVDPPPQDAVYTRGVVAMAKTPDEAPGTSGSQFFVVTGADIGLPPEYAVVGEVTAGMDTVLAIDGLGMDDGPPSTPVVMEKVTVEES